ncbi:type II toxin-antitoxin system Phd/YefM family antitoxin [Candidatus Nitrospira salsa]
MRRGLFIQINETHRPVVITKNGEPKVVLQDPQSYENMRNALGLLKFISQGEDDIKNDKTTAQAEVFKKLEMHLHGQWNNPTVKAVLLSPFKTHAK